MSNEDKITILNKAKLKITSKINIGLCYAISSSYQELKNNDYKSISWVLKEFDLLKFKPESVNKGHFWWNINDIDIRVSVIDKLINQFSI